MMHSLSPPEALRLIGGSVYELIPFFVPDERDWAVHE